MRSSKNTTYFNDYRTYALTEVESGHGLGLQTARNHIDKIEFRQKTIRGIQHLGINLVELNSKIAQLTAALGA